MTRARADRSCKSASEPATNPAAEIAALARRDWFCFAVVVLLAFLIRLVYLFQIRDVVFFQILIVDSEAYDQWATRIAGGEWLGREVFYQAPLYPYFLALCQRAVGHDLWNLRVVQIALGAVSCGFLFFAARWIFSPLVAGVGAARRVGLVAGALLALYGPAVFFDGLIQKAVLDGFLGTLLLALLGRYALRPGRLSLVAAGLTLGGFILTRENAVLAYFVIAAWLLVGLRGALPTWGRRVRSAAVFTLGAAVPLLVVGVRNYAVGGEFILTTSQLGPNLYIGNHAGATGVLAPLRAGRDGPRYERIDATELAAAAVGRELTPSEVSRYWVRRVVEYVTTQPLGWLALLGRKAALLVNTHEVADAEDIYYYERQSWLLRGLLWCGHFGVLLPLAAAGIAFAWPDRRRLWLLHGLLAAFAAGVLIFYVFARYRYPLVPPLMLFAAFALVRGVAAARGRDFGSLCWPAGAAIIAAVVANWPIERRDAYLATAYSNAGAALSEHGRAGEALVVFQEALRLAPTRADIYLNLGICYGRLHRLGDALTALRRADDFRPGDPLIESQLGTALAESGDLAGAAERLMSAWRGWPEDEATARNLIAVLRMLKRYPDLAAVLRQRQQAAPQDRMRTIELAWTLATCPDAAIRDGPAAARLATAADSGDAASLDVLAAALAESGAFEEAVQAAERALALARQSGLADLATGLGARLELYRARQPYRE